MIKNPKANLLILAAAPCCAVTSCQPPDTELLPGCLAAPGVCSLQSAAVPSWGGSGLAESCSCTSLWINLGETLLSTIQQTSAVAKSLPSRRV